LAVSQYAHFVLLKIFKYGTLVDWTIVTKRFVGHMSTLAVHATASQVMAVMVKTVPKHLFAPLQQEWYGPHVSLFYRSLSVTDPRSAAVTTGTTTTTLPTLAWNLLQLPTKKEVTIEYVRRLIHKGLTKNLFGYGYFQSLLYEFLQVITPDEIRTRVAPVMANHLLPLLRTRNGVQAACLLISYGTPKDRKRFAKCLKGYSTSILQNHDSYLALLRLVQVTDDTVAIQKNVLAELLMSGGGGNKNPKDTTTTGDNDTAVVGSTAAGGSNNVLKDLINHDNGVKLFLMLLHDVHHNSNNNNELLLSNDDNDDNAIMMMIDQHPPPPPPKQQRNKISLSFLDPYEQSVLFESGII
jgi:hypothetical protein